MAISNEARIKGTLLIESRLVSLKEIDHKIAESYVAYSSKGDLPSLAAEGAPS